MGHPLNDHVKIGGVGHGVPPAMLCNQLEKSWVQQALDLLKIPDEVQHPKPEECHISLKGQTFKGT